MSAQEPEAARDEFWVSVETTLGLQALRDFCADIERLFRINPYLEFQAWHSDAEDLYRARFRNLSNQQDVRLEMHIERQSPDEFALVYRDGVKARTHLRLEATAAGSRLTITDDYSRLAPSERALRLAEVDKSLAAWGWALSAYLRREQRWGHFAAWRWFMRRWWLPMSPRARRVSTILVLIAAAELALVLLVALIYWIEFRN